MCNHSFNKMLPHPGIIISKSFEILFRWNNSLRKQNLRLNCMVLFNGQPYWFHFLYNFEFPFRIPGRHSRRMERGGSEY